MVRNFRDKNGKRYNIWLRAHFSYIRSATKLREVLDNSINTIKPDNLRTALQNKPYMEVMRYFGIITKSTYLKEEKDANRNP
jgi:hypothetical protein